MRPHGLKTPCVHSTLKGVRRKLCRGAIGHSWGHLKSCVGAARCQHSGNAAGDQRIQSLPLVAHHIEGPVECEVQALERHAASTM